MAAASESQGLKIAVAVCVALSVVLSVTSYLLYSSYSKALSQQEAAEKSKGEADKAAALATSNFRDLRTKVGHANLEEWDAVNKAIEKDTKDLQASVQSLSTEVAKSVKDAQEKGLSNEEVGRLTAEAQRIVAEINAEPGRTLNSLMNRLGELVKTQSLLTNAIALDNIDLRTTLEGINETGRQKLAVQEEAAQKSTTTLNEEHAKYEQMRTELLAKLDDLQSTNAQQATQITTLESKVRQMAETQKRREGELLAQLETWRTRALQSSEVLTQSVGNITAVDQARREVRVNLTQRMGARPQMKMAVFNRNATGLLTDRPKGHIQLTSVGASDSTARIIDQTNTADPIRAGDQLGGGVWRPNDPEQFALIGTIDINRDGQDDRESLKRMIQSYGGVVSYDLPPPGAGQKSGELTAQITYYVTDERVPLGNRPRREGEVSADQGEFVKTKSEALRQASQLGIRPMPIERLLPLLGFSYGTASSAPGRVESIDRRTSESLQFPRGRSAPVPRPPAPAEDDEATKEEEEEAPMR